MHLLFLTFFLLISLYPLNLSAGIHSQSRIYEYDELHKLFEALYLSSSEINVGSDLLLSGKDAKNILELWKERHPDPDPNQNRLINNIESILGNITDSNYVSIKAGVDYLHHNIPDSSRTNPFYKKFRDHDFQNKYHNRGRFFDGILEMSLYKSLFLSSRISARNDWKNFNSRQTDFPQKFHELNINVNEKSILYWRIDNISLMAGKDRLSLGLGEFSKLLISSNLPPVDHFQFSINHQDRLALTFIVAWMKNALLQDEHPKVLYAHRLSYRFFQRFTLAITELQITNQSFNFKYVNPFMIYHNEYEYSSRRNMLSAIDAEAVLGYGVKMYSSFAVDELDVDVLENSGSKNREAWGLISGLKQIQPFGLYNAQWVIEWSKLTKWMYNHAYPWFDFYTLNYVYEEKQQEANLTEFHHFIGHDPGPNSQALKARFSWNNFDLIYKYILQGEIPIFQRAFTPVISSPEEKKIVLGLCYKEKFINNRLNLNMAFYNTTVRNFHHQSGLNKSLSEVWVSLGFEIYENKW
jgi:hypothetical protein